MAIVRRGVRDVSNAALLAVGLMAASAGCDIQAAEPAAQCGKGETPLKHSGLCQRAATALLRDPGTPPPAAVEGCHWVIRDTPFATNVLLYRTLQCARGETLVELNVGNHQSDLVYTRRADGGGASDADGEPLVLARIFAGDPDGRGRAQWEARDSMQNPAQAKQCGLKPPYQAEGLPGDALIVDIARSQAALESDDAGPECGPFGYNPAGGSIDFWRTHQGYAWFFQMGTDVWDIDPGSFTIVEKGADGRWRPLADPVGEAGS